MRPNDTRLRKNILNELSSDYMDGGKRNITFSLPALLIEEFKNDCKENGVKMNSVVFKLIEKYLASNEVSDRYEN